MSNFQPLEVVGRDSETQLQVGETLNNNLACKGLTGTQMSPHVRPMLFHPCGARTVIYMRIQASSKPNYTFTKIGKEFV